jgi:AraC-like DNA-binding protein
MLEFLRWLTHLLVAAAAVQGIVIAAMAWRRRERSAMVWFALLMLALGLLSALDYVEDGSTAAAVTSVALSSALWIPAPALWLYLRQALGLAPLSRPRQWLHLLPAALMTPVCMLMAWRLWHTMQDPIHPTIPPGWATWNAVLIAGALIGAAVYLTLSMRWLRRHRLALRSVVANAEAHELRWLEHLLVVAAVIALVWLTGLAFDHAWMRLLTGLAQPLCVLYLGVRAIQQPFVLGYEWLQAQQGPQSVSDEAEESPSTALPDTAALPVQPDTETRPAYARSGLTDARAQSLLSALDELMRSEKPYLEEDLTLPSLALRLGVAPQLLSQLLNQSLGRSFHDYIADHRVRDVMRCLQDPAYDGQTVLALANDAGFRSKTAFHQAFRRVSGTTPSRYRQQRPLTVD